MSGPRRVIVLSDGIRGHEHQSMGVAAWIGRLCGADVSKIEIPKLTGARRFLMIKLAARRLKSASPEAAGKWLIASGFSHDILGRGPGTLFISAGSSAAPFCLALARACGGKSAVLMTPSVLGLKPFDFAIAPEHDHPCRGDNVLVTLGAPNHIYIPDLKAEAEKHFTPLLPMPDVVIALLLGGSDANYELDADWIRSVLPGLREASERRGAALLVTTSRRTGRAADDAVKEVLGSSARYMVLASRSDENPIPAMLGAATHVLVTEDSVSMASEAVTAGFRIGLLRVRRRRGSAFRGFFGGGARRFDAMFAAMERRGLIDDLGAKADMDSFLARNGRVTGSPFCEAERAAKWILERWEDGKR